MEEVEKLTALKKAYADIILNTAKEAATRIMVLERRARQFQQELFVSKDESMNMLLRLKQMSDSKIAELELTSLSQRKRIEELEAQLHKSEDTVTDLISQLKGVEDELAKMKNNQVKPLEEEIIIKESAAFCEDASQVNKPITSESILLPPPDSGPGTISTSGSKDTPLDLRNIDDNGCSVSENATLLTEPSSDFQAEDHYAGKSDLACIIMNNKEPELYRNGCTQRIRAFERNLLNGELPLPPQTDNQYSDLKNESIIREEEITEQNGTVSSPKDVNVDLVKKEVSGLEELLKNDGICDNDQPVKFLRRFSSRKTRSRYRIAKVTSSTDQATKTHEPSILSRCVTYSCPDASEDSSKKVEEDVQKTSDSHLTTVASLSTTDVTPLSKCIDGIGSDAKILPSVGISADEGTECLDKSELTRQNTEVADMPGVPLTDSDLMDKKTCETTGGAVIPADKFLKYTFRRKRKKGTLTCPVEDTSPEKNTTKRRSVEKQNVAPEPEKSSLIVESSRDTRRLAQVARQIFAIHMRRVRGCTEELNPLFVGSTLICVGLDVWNPTLALRLISLSEKRWWQ